MRLTEYHEIVTSSVNGQWAQALDQVTELGWGQFIFDLEADGLMEDIEKLKLLSKLVRLRSLKEEA